MTDHRYITLKLLGMQINSTPLPLINFEKFTIDDKKWILDDNSKRRK